MTTSTVVWSLLTVIAFCMIPPAMLWDDTGFLVVAASVLALFGNASALIYSLILEAKTR